MTSDKKLTCLIVEDEPIAAEVLQDYISQIAFLDLKGICKDALYALEFLREESVEVLFLDIHLPKLKGLDFLKTLPKKPQTILTTAYHNYALDAFEEGVVDYLMKPIEFSRFLKAVNKLKREEAVGDSDQKRPFHFFNVNKKKIRVYYDEITYIESLKDYSRIFFGNTSILVNESMSDLEVQLQAFNFLRIHRSFIVALNKVEAYTTTEVEINGKSLPIGRTYQEKVREWLG
ncbi:MAG TPA: LytTR family DNA-binding domain-containing protein [Saprospiraceae bacterium]|nr:LytTR family DNA-binding domain-containing protein [Saprospiraceae bacterium]HMQ82415.1 LytTR family DNA-binding domain-containing protein [Saprospiraceae bacterium]